MKSNHWESGSESPVNPLEFSLCRKVPNFKDAGLSKRGYLELVRNSENNRQALAEIIDAYDDFFTGYKRVDTFLGDSPYEKGMVECDSRWYDPGNLHLLMVRAKDLLGGSVNTQTVQYATALVTAYFTDSMVKIEEEIESIDDMKYSLKDTGKEIRRLSIDEREMETQEELSELHTFVDIYNEAIADSFAVIDAERKNLHRALQALHFISGTFS